MITGRLLSRGVYFGGNANNGANCGFVYGNSNNAPSNTNANIGSRQYFSNGLNACNKNKRGNDLAAWQKNTKQKNGVGRNALRIGYRTLLNEKQSNEAYR